MRILEFTDMWSSDKEYAMLSHVVHWQYAEDPLFEEYEETVPKSLWSKEHKILKTRKIGSRKGSIITLVDGTQTWVQESPAKITQIVQDAINAERNGA